MAAQADVVFRMAADIGSAMAALKQVEEQLVEVGKAGQKAKTDLSGLLDDELEKAFKRLDEATKAVTGGQVSLSGVGKGLAVVLGGTAAVAAGLGAALYQGVGAAIESEDAINRLRSALASQGAETMNNVNQLTGLASALQETTRYGDEAIMGMQALALNLGVNARDMGKFTEATVDMAAALHIDLDTAARQLAQTLDGTAGRLSQQIPALQGMSEAALKAGGAIDLVRERFRGMAEQDAQTLGGALDQLKNMLGETVEQFGLGFTGASDMAGAVRQLKDWVVEATPLVKSLGEAIGYAAREIIPLVSGAAQVLGDAMSGMFGEDQLGEIERTKVALGKAQESLAKAQNELAEKQRNPVFWGATAIKETEGRVKQLTAEVEHLSSVLPTLGKSVQGASAKPGTLDAGVVGGAGDTTKAQITDAQKLEEEFAKLVNLNETLRNIGADVYATDAERLDVVRGQLAATEALGEKIKRAILEGTLTREEADAMLQPLADAAGDFFLQARQDAIANGGAGLEDVRGVQTSDGPNMFTQYGNSDALDAMEREMEMRQQLIDLGFTQAEATQLAAEATEREANAHSAAFLSMQKSEQSQRRAWATKIQFRQATMASVAALAQEALAGTLSAQSLLKAGLQYLAEWAGKKSIASFAQSADEMAAYTASHGTDAPMLAAATQHMHAGTMWGVLAAGAGVAAAAVGSGGGGGGGGGRRDDTGEDELTSFGSTRRGVTQPAEAGPRVAVYFTGGVVAGTSPEEFSRMIQPYIEQTVQEAGNRSSSRRG